MREAREEMVDNLRDIRELAGDPAAYRAELQRRWTGLLSYRYIGRKHSSMNLGPEDNTVRLRRDMRNKAGGVMVAPLAIASPEGSQTDLVAVPNPVTPCSRPPGGVGCARPSPARPAIARHAWPS